MSAPVGVRFSSLPELVAFGALAYLIGSLALVLLRIAWLFLRRRRP